MTAGLVASSRCVRTAPQHGRRCLPLRQRARHTRVTMAATPPRPGDVFHVTSQDGLPSWLEIRPAPKKVAKGSGFVGGSSSSSSSLSSSSAVDGVVSGLKVKVTLDDAGQPAHMTPTGKADDLPANLLRRAAERWCELTKGSDNPEAFADMVRSAATPARRSASGAKGKGIQLASATRTATLKTLLEDVGENAAPWRDGDTAAATRANVSDDGDDNVDVAGAVQQAGELAALLAGQRGLCIVQLWAAARPDEAWTHNPLVVRLLRMADKDDGVDAVLSIATRSGEPQAISLIVHATSPVGFTSRAEALTVMGAQAAMVPDSPKDKATIGRLLGYPCEAVREHIVHTHNQSWDDSDADQVEAKLAELGDVELPWRQEAPRLFAKV